MSGKNVRYSVEIKRAAVTAARSAASDCSITQVQQLEPDSPLSPIFQNQEYWRQAPLRVQRQEFPVAVQAA